MLNDDEKKELERLREAKKKTETYRNNYSKKNYKRLVCMYPVEREKIFSKALKQSGKSISSYIIDLIDSDLKQRGFLSE